MARAHSRHSPPTSLLVVRFLESSESLLSVHHLQTHPIIRGQLPLKGVLFAVVSLINRVLSAIEIFATTRPIPFAERWHVETFSMWNREEKTRLASMQRRTRQVTKTTVET